MKSRIKRTATHCRESLLLWCSWSDAWAMFYGWNCVRSPTREGTNIERRNGELQIDYCGDMSATRWSDLFFVVSYFQEKCSKDTLNDLRETALFIHGAYSLLPLIARFMGPIWGRQDPGGPHVGPMNLAIWDYSPHFIMELITYTCWY